MKTQGSMRNWIN